MPVQFLRSLAMGLVIAASGMAARGAPSDGEAAPGDDLFVASGTVRIDQPVQGDLIVVGGHVDVVAPVSGDVVVAGGNVHLAGEVGGSVFSAAGHLVVDGKIDRNLRAVGGQVELDENASVHRNVAALAGQLQDRGAIGGSLHGGAGHLVVDGVVGGDVFARADEVELGPRARVGGTLHVGSAKPLSRSPEALVERGVDALPPPAHARERRSHVSPVVWPLGLTLVAWLLLAAFPALTARTSAGIAGHLGRCALLGVAWLAGAPLAILILVVSLIGIPLALVSLALYLALLPVAVAVAAVGVGDALLGRWFPAHAQRLWARCAGAAACLVALTALQAIPPLAAAMGLLACLIGAGSLLGLWIRSGGDAAARPTSAMAAT